MFLFIINLPIKLAKAVQARKLKLKLNELILLIRLWFMRAVWISAHSGTICGAGLYAFTLGGSKGTYSWTKKSHYLRNLLKSIEPYTAAANVCGAKKHFFFSPMSNVLVRKWSESLAHFIRIMLIMSRKNSLANHSHVLSCEVTILLPANIGGCSAKWIYGHWPGQTPPTWPSGYKTFMRFVSVLWGNFHVDAIWKLMPSFHVEPMLAINGNRVPLAL